jgi:hypothetical protein
VPSPPAGPWRKRPILRRKVTAIARSVPAVVMAMCLADPACGQECPHASTTGPAIASEVRTLEGLLVFHDGLRQWMELRLDEPACDKRSVQLTASEDHSPPLEVFRGCRVKSHGALYFSPTGYYVLDVFQTVDRIDPAEPCLKQPPFPDYSALEPDKAIRAYRVDMQVNNRPGDHPIVFHVTGAHRDLQPWQAYARYALTGGSVLYGRCGAGFVIDKVFGTPQANPAHVDDPRTPGDMAAFDPAWAAQSGRWDLHLGYTCIREK